MRSQVLQLRTILALSLFILIFTIGCASGSLTKNTDPLLSRSALKGQVLRFREGHEGKLTNQICSSYKEGKCIPDIAEYDLKYPSVRDALRKLKFRCDVGGKRYRICEDRSGLCRRNDDTVKRFLFIPVKRIRNEEYLDSEKDFKFLSDAKTRCEAFKGEE